MLRRFLSKIFGAEKAEPDASSGKLDAKDVIERINAHARPCVRALHADQISRSKLGGIPTVPAGFEWPDWNGVPLQFLCQLDLAELQGALPLEWLPDSGLLSFFYDEGQSTWGFDPADLGSWRVMQFEADVVLAPAIFPQGSNAASVLPEVFLKFEKQASLPDPERAGLHFSQIPDEAWEYLEGYRFPEEPLHQIAGWPCAVQNEGMELECQLASNGVYVGGSDGYGSDEAKRLAEGSGQWRLLLQLDSDDDAEMQWGDVGRLYFWVKEAESAKGDFSGVWMILQCS
jgi:uncharacterized protein YwqG